jgi:alpha-1,3-glucosyltransferase
MLIKKLEKESEKGTFLPEEAFLDRKVVYALHGILILFSFFMRYCVSMFPYSEEGILPLYEDYEVHRRWMEITLHVPVKKWYFYESSSWGIDSPPLSAYMSYLLGYVGWLIEPKWVELGGGLESVEHKWFMKMTVCMMDLLVYYTAVYRFVYLVFGHSPKDSKKRFYLTCVLLCMQPALILIDHGHFQYTHVMLGLTLWVINCLWNEQFLLATFFFISSICFKQMTLYYLPIYASYLLGICWERRYRRGGLLMIKLICTSLFTLMIYFVPFLTKDRSVIIQILQRIFPVSRTMFEDKVANLWYFLSILMGSPCLFSPYQLVILS